MNTVLFSHNDCTRHITPRGHPERVERLERLEEVFNQPEFSAIERLDAPLCELDHLTLAHPQSYVDQIQNLEPVHGFAYIDADTSMSNGSWNAARRAVGAIVQATDMVFEGSAKNAFCAVRPPGHHAEKTRGMGFCLFGTVAIGALHAIQKHGLERVAILDFDVHHGNGTSNILWDERSVLFASTHEMPLYPGSGYESERGSFNQIINKPLETGTGSAEFRAAMNSIIDRMDKFKPELIFISAGFDAHYDDPLASLRLDEEDFYWATGEMKDLARAHCKDRLVSSLEGGYSILGLTTSVKAHLTALME
ncbi:MAG: histone deacetylase family protein [Rhodobacteraceae bacterium]|nr:histone deacetylase family protein [Paracoccaceae bacterium]